MAYTICDKYGDCKPLRVLVPNVHGEIEVKAEFTPAWWVCDPCNRSENRYEITYRSDQEKPQYLPWYQVVTTDDTEEDVAVKVKYYQRVIAARNAMDAASAEYRRLTGCGWSACPA
jgi:hypothetical protein